MRTATSEDADGSSGTTRLTATAAAAGGVLAQATSDFVPYALLAAILLATLAAAQRRARAGGWTSSTGRGACSGGRS